MRGYALREGERQRKEKKKTMEKCACFVFFSARVKEGVSEDEAPSARQVGTEELGKESRRSKRESNRSNERASWQVWFR